MMNLKTILIVDDEKSIRDGLKVLVPWEEHGFHIIGEATNGREALVIIHEQQPDIVITDLIMPEYNGLELSETIQQQYPDTQFLVLSSYDDFPYVTEAFKNGAIDYLLKPTLTADKLLAILKRIAKKTTKKEQFFAEEDRLSQHLNRYLSGYPIEEEYLLTQYFDQPNYYLIYTNLLWYQNKQQVTDYLKQTLLKKVALKELFYLIETTECGLIFTSHLPYELLHIELTDTLRALKRIEPDLFFVLSPATHSLESIKNKIQLLKNEGNEQYFYFKRHIVLKEEDFLDLNTFEEFDTKKYLRSLINEDFHLSITRIEDYFNSTIERMPKPDLLKQETSNIFYTLFTLLLDFCDKPADIQLLKQTFLFKINQVKYLEDFSLLVLTTLGELRTLIEDNQIHHASENETIQQMTQYIERNFQKNISLTTLADTFHFNYNYVSKLFSQHYNTSFTDYLNSIRLNEARHLLLTSDSNLSEIADKCGYADLSYFSKLFKKYYGTSPSKYRRENQL